MNFIRNIKNFRSKVILGHFSSNTVPSQNIVDLSFPTLVFLVRLSLKIYLINLKDNSTIFRGRLHFKVDYSVIDLRAGS